MCKRWAKARAVGAKGMRDQSETGKVHGYQSLQGLETTPEIYCLIPNAIAEH